MMHYALLCSCTSNMLVYIGLCVIYILPPNCHLVNLCVDRTKDTTDSVMGFGIDHDNVSLS